MEMQGLVPEKLWDKEPLHGILDYIFSQYKHYMILFRDLLADIQVTMFSQQKINI